MAKILYHGDFRVHNPAPYYHPENPYRLDVAMYSLTSHGLLEEATLVEPSKADVLSVYASVHDPGYLRGILREPPPGEVLWVDPDTYISHGTVRALQRLAGSVVDAVNLLTSGEKLVVILGRPPGHHAGVGGRALGAPTLGFCLVNTVAALAQRLIEAGGRSVRVAVLDIDLHHGNGTQEIFYERGDVLHVDIHQDSRTIYPGTGFPWQVGRGPGRGTKININVPVDARDDIMLHALSEAVSFISSWSPDYVLVSAGFDAYRGDNDMGLIEAGSKYYHEAGSALRRLGVPVAVFLEGGYGAGLERGLPALLYGLLGKSDPIRDDVKESHKHVWNEYNRLLSMLKEELARSG
ncbi:histone deacetylase family protein [Stetteria hydrogenophila]